MEDFTAQPTYQFFNQLIETKTPIVPMLSSVKVTKNAIVRKELNILYYNPQKKCFRRLYNNSFAEFMFDHLLSFERSISSKTLAGIVRPSKPDVIEEWSGDTIEKVNHKPFSLYKGILSIIGKNDGLPLIVRQNSGIIGDIIPGVKLMLDGKKRTMIRQRIKQLETLQYRIAEIVGHNPITTNQAHCGEMKVILEEKYQGLSDKQIARLEKFGKL